MMEKSLSSLLAGTLAGLFLPAIVSTAGTTDPAVVCVREFLQIEIGKNGKEARHRVEEIYAVNGHGEEVRGLREWRLPCSFPWDPKKAEVKIWNDHGTWFQKNLTHFKDVGVERPGIFISDTRHLVLEVPLLQPGDTLRFRYETLREPFLGMNLRTFPMSSFQVRESIYQVKIPSDLDPRYRLWNGLADPEVKHDGDKIIWTWSLRNPEQYVPETLSPPVEDVLPVVSIGVNRIAWGPAGSWDALAATYWERARDRVQAVLTAELPPRTEIHRSSFDLCLERTQNNIRYVAIELGVGGFIPHASTETTRRKFGDCKDMATVLLSLLEAEQVSGALAIVRTRNEFAGLTIDPLPTLWFFNHMVVCAPSPEGPVWLDATHRYGTAANPRSDIQGASALTVSGPDAGYHRIPVNDSSANRESRTIRLREEDKGRWQVYLDLEWIGSPAQDLRHRIEAGLEMVNVVEEIVEDLECTPLAFIERDDLRISMPSPDTMTVSLSFPVQPPVTGNVLRPCWTRNPYPLDVFSARERKTDVYWPLPGTFTDTLIVESHSWTLADLPDTSWTFESGGVCFLAEQVSSEKTLRLVRTSIISSLILPSSSWEEARKARGRIMRWSSQNLIAGK